MPANTRVNAFGAIGSAVLAGTDEGIYVSRNQGVDWKPGSGAAVGSGRILSFAAIADAAYAGTDRSGMLISIDGGANWVLDSNCPFRYVRSLLAHEGALYAGTDAQGVFVSRNGGRSWSAIGRGLPDGAQIFSMAQLKGKVFAGLYSKGLYVWTSQERRWRKVGPVSPLALATAGETLLAGHNPGGIRRSDDLGATWIPAEIRFSEDLGSAPVWELGSGPGFAIAGISAGIYYSEDHGRTWVRATTGLPANAAGIAFFGAGSFVLASASIETRQVTDVLPRGYLLGRKQRTLAALRLCGFANESNGAQVPGSAPDLNVVRSKISRSLAKLPSRQAAGSTPHKLRHARSRRSAD